MSKHRKKKQNVSNLDKVAKAQHKNEYFRKIRKVLDAIGCSHVLALMPPNELDLMYTIRCQAINVTIAKGDVMPPGKLKWIRRLISAMLKRYEVQLVKDGKKVDLDTFFTAGITLVWYGSVLEFDDYPRADEVKEALIPYAMDKQYKNMAFIELRHIASVTSQMMSDVTKRIYWATVNLNMNNEKANQGFHMVWHSTPAEKINVKIKGETHVAYRLGVPEYQKGPKWISIADPDKKLPDHKQKKPVDVYIQAHALFRLAERNDCVTREILMQELIKTFENPVFTLDQQSGKILIEYKLYNVKTGYLLVSMVDNKLVIRTFLFITQTGSPEGNKLRRNARLRKDEITFLELDRLSTFMTSEMQENKHIRQYFAEAGLKPMFELYKILKDKNITIARHANTTLIEDYLGIDLTKEFMEEETLEKEQNENENEIEDEEENELNEEDGATEKGASPKTRPKVSENSVNKIHWTKKIILGVITFVIRIFDLLAVQQAKNSEKSGSKKQTDDNDIPAHDKDDKFSSSKLSLPGKIAGWTIILTIGLIYTLIMIPINLIRRLIKGKKSETNRIDYRQFVAGRKKKKKR